jgi:1-acyl-sn-glycerol-3-phosphate acyltransferase
VEVEGVENIPRAGPVVVVVNHLSMADVPLILTILPRRTICLAAERLRGAPLIRRFLDLGHAIYIQRGEADIDALNKCLEVLRAGGMVGLAPEGTRSPTGGLSRGHTGAAYLAVEAAAPVLPVVAYGQENLLANIKRFKRTRIRVRIGAPLMLDAGSQTAAKLQWDTDSVMTSLAAMLPIGYRGAYAKDAHRSPAAVDN